MRHLDDCLVSIWQRILVKLRTADPASSLPAASRPGPPQRPPHPTHLRRQGSCASRTARPADAGIRRMNGGSGRLSRPGFAVFDRGSSSLRMCQGSLWTDSTWSSLRLPRRGILRRGIVFALPKRAPHRGVSGSSWLEFYPTPSARSYGSSQNEGQVPHDRPSRGTPSLESGTRSWPTPRASQRRVMGSVYRNGEKTGSLSLPELAERWPTPIATDVEKGVGTYRRGNPTLKQEAEQWDAARVFPRFRLAPRTGEVGSACSMRAGGTCSRRSTKPRRLNARFVAWLQGWLTATELMVFDCSATEWCPRRPPSPADRWLRSLAMPGTEDLADGPDPVDSCLETPDYDICPDCDCELGSTPGCRLCDLDQRSSGGSVMVAS